MAEVAPQHADDFAVRIAEYITFGVHTLSYGVFIVVRCTFIIMAVLTGKVFAIGRDPHVRRYMMEGVQVSRLGWDNFAEIVGSLFSSSAGRIPAPVPEIIVHRTTVTETLTSPPVINVIPPVSPVTFPDSLPPTPDSVSPPPSPDFGSIDEQLFQQVAATLDPTAPQLPPRHVEPLPPANIPIVGLPGHTGYAIFEEESSHSGPWFAVAVGTDVGIFKCWVRVSPLVTGISGNIFSAYRSRAEALDAFMAAYRRKAVHLVPKLVQSDDD